MVRRKTWPPKGARRPPFLFPADPLPPRLKASAAAVLAEVELLNNFRRGKRVALHASYDTATTRGTTAWPSADQWTCQRTRRQAGDRRPSTSPNSCDHPESADGVAITVQQLSCREPACPPVEAVIAVQAVSPCRCNIHDPLTTITVEWWHAFSSTTRMKNRLRTTDKRIPVTE
jgi:hypothetical protein